jgi:carboxymethylenebutenolidase
MPHPQPAGLLVAPRGGTGPGVLVLHAWWGLNATIKAFCARLADAGFLAFAPDVYHGQVAETIADAEALVNALDNDQAQTEIAAAARFLAERAAPNGGLAVIGFSLGANFALDLATTNPAPIAAVVIFYGTGDGDFSQSRAAYLGHFAADDPYEPQAGVAALEQQLSRAGRPVTFYQYPDTGHWFFEPDRVDAFDPAAANLAWERTLAFLRQHAAE